MNLLSQLLFIPLAGALAFGRPRAALVTLCLIGVSELFGGML